jgi:hypothetical protein
MDLMALSAVSLLIIARPGYVGKGTRLVYNTKKSEWRCVNAYGAVK